MDSDNKDNPLTTNVSLAIAENGIPYSGLGIGYSDSIIDNERYGMRKFVYYNRGGGQFPGDGDPTTALQYYNYMKGVWRDKSSMVWGGNGHPSGGGTVPADLLFPGYSDPLNWSTGGAAVSPTLWSEESVGNTKYDRRFIQSAGPFTLEPGAVNNITVGVVWARATGGGPFASVEKLRLADDKAQALFDNCFKIINGPHAPEISFQELENELILYIQNPKGSNNDDEDYAEVDYNIVIPDTLNGVYISEQYKDTLKEYQFQGYQIFQVKNNTVTVNDIYNPDLARPVIQCDIKDGVGQIINFTYSDQYQANEPKEMVYGNDAGIQHSFRIKKDLFSSGDSRLVNHKTYYYIAISYAHNQFKRYDPLDPLALDGQTKPYLSSRNRYGGAAIEVVSAIPHNPSPENGGTFANAQYGDMPQIKRIEGQGNGGNNLDLTYDSELTIVNSKFMDYPIYEAGKGPIQVKVVDPLNVQGGEFKVKFIDDDNDGDLTNATWVLQDAAGNTVETSERSIEIENEQLIMDYGISVSIKQVDDPGINYEQNNGAIEGTISYADSSKPWLAGVNDIDGASDWNWIRSGNTCDPTGNISLFDDYGTGSCLSTSSNPNFVSYDPDQDFEQMVGGTWSPYCLVSRPMGTTITHAPGFTRDNGISIKISKLKDLPSVDIVITKNQDLWSKCVVFETGTDPVLAVGGAEHLDMRQSPSWNKNGTYDNSILGMSWFPGYAINVETGERLNIAFGEDSWLAGEKGADMIWNPTSNMTAGVNNEIRWGGKHFIYVFRKDDMLGLPAYDECQQLYAKVSSGNVNQLRDVFRSCAWVGMPMLEDGYSLYETDVKIRLRVNKPYRSFATSSLENNDLPLYGFNMDGLETMYNHGIAADSALMLINVVPNPYYSYSEYETGQLDNRVKITNLPENCEISIYNVSGTLIRRYRKSDPKTSLDWDLKNHAQIPISSGVYLIHVNVPDVGERVLKWFGTVRPTDLNTF